MKVTIINCFDVYDHRVEVFACGQPSGIGFDPQFPAYAEVYADTLSGGV